MGQTCGICSTSDSCFCCVELTNTAVKSHWWGLLLALLLLPCSTTSLKTPLIQSPTTSSPQPQGLTAYYVSDSCFWSKSCKALPYDAKYVNEVADRMTLVFG